MMRTAAFLGIGIILSALAGSAVGATLYVNIGGTGGAYASIQAAIDAAAHSGDEIEVAPGTYYEGIRFNGKAVRLYSSGGASVTTIDGTGQPQVVQCFQFEGPGTILEGFTITGGSSTGMYNEFSSPTVTNCTFSDNSSPADGGGMRNDWSDPTVTNCTFSYNYSSANGGGMSNWCSSPTVTNCTFSDNSSTADGGGMSNAYSSSPTVTDCTFSDNFTWSGDGGGMCNGDSSSPTVTNCTFSYNFGNFGGGMYNTQSDPTVTDCAFSDNSGGYYGGGMCNFGSSPTVTNGTFTGNSAVYGGAMHNDSSSPTVTNGTFTGNSATYGGGMGNKNSNPTVTNGTFTDNSATAGGGMYNDSSSPTVSNCILWSNSPQQIIGTATVSYSDVQGGFSGTDNIDADPGFAGGLRLTAGSRCIDTGTNSPAGGLPSPDPDGNPRPLDGDLDGAAVADMGAYEFVAIPRTLNILFSPNGSVTTPGEGSFQYVSGTSASVVATADPHYRFTSWTGTAVDAVKVADAAAASTTVLMDADYTLQASFAIDQHTLTTSSNAGGDVTTPGEATYTYDYGTIVNLVAAADAHYHFVNWTGPVANSGSATTTVTITGDTTVSATFAIDQHMLTVGSDGNGETTGLSGAYPWGSAVAITATPHANYHFVNWTTSGSVTVTDPASSDTAVTVNGDGTVMANFAINQHTLTVTSDGNGSTTGSGVYDWGSTPAITASPNANYHFVNWTSSGSVTVTDPASSDTTVTVNGDGTVTAHFAIDQHTLTTSSNAGGDVTTPGEATYTYDYGTIVNLVAAADAHYHFVNWTGPVANSGSATTTVTITGDTTVAAVFAIDQHSLTTSSNDGGDVTTPGEGTGSYAYGAMVDLAATPDAHYHFVEWTGPVANPSSPTTTVTITGDTTVEAVFAIDQHTITITSTVGGGVTSPGTGTFVYDYGTVLHLEAQAAPLFQFAGWTGSVCDTSQPTCITVQADHHVCATFVSVRDTLYVDDNALGDPNADGTPEQPLNSIQEAIEVARDGAQILVEGGIYHEQLDLMGKNICLQGLWLSDPNVTEEPVVDGNGVGPVVTFRGGEDANCVLAGLRIQGGLAPTGAAILCSGSPTIMNCLIVGNRATGLQGATILCANSNAMFINCTITENAADAYGAMIACVDSDVMLTNSILWGNAPSVIRTVSGAAPTITYCDIEGGCAGSGNVDQDPAFVAAGSWCDAGILGWSCDDVWTCGDYHLLSEVGHWDAATGGYVEDAATSPCIDAGDPAGECTAEPLPNGDRINMGAYGGTSQAGLSHQ